MDYTALTDEQLGAERVKILTVIEQRENLKRIPGQVADLCRTYQEGGGDPAVLEQAISGAEAPPAQGAV